MVKKKESGLENLSEFKHIKNTDKRIGEISRTVVNLLAPKGIIKQLTRNSGEGSDRGRGRPKGTYKARYVPGVGVVRVPTAVYNKMMSAVKAKRRLAEAQKQAAIQQRYEAQQIAAEQVAMQQDPRFQPQDPFLESPDMEHEQNVADAKQRMLIEEQLRMQQQSSQPAQRSVFQKAGEVARRFGANVSRLGTPRPSYQQVDEYGRVISPPSGGFGFGREVPQRMINPKVTAVSERSSILNQPNIFNRPENATITFKRRF